MTADATAAADEGAPAGRWVVALACAVVTVPSLVAAVRAVRWGWVPASDQGTIGVRALDVLTRDTPRLGQLSGLSRAAGQPTRSLGPMGYWPFALPARLGPLWGPPVVAACLSAVAMVATVRLAARRGGPGLALAVAGGLVLAARAVNPTNLASTWNPALGIMPMALLVLLAWSLAEGEVRLLPVAVLVGSFCAQVHTALLLPTLAALGGGVGIALVAARGRIGWRPVLLATVVAGACWCLPLIDQVTGDPGNLSRIAAADVSEPSGAPITGRVLADTLGVPPAFARADDRPVEQADVLQHAPSRVALVGAVLVVCGLVLLVARAARRRDREAAVGPALVLAVLLAGTATVWLTPGEQFLVLTYTTWWMVPVGMLAWVLLAHALLDRIGQMDPFGSRATRLDGRAVRVGAVVAGVVLLAVGVLAPGRAEPEEPIHTEARLVGDAVAGRVDVGGRYRVDGGGTAPSMLVASTAYRIRRAGARPIVPGNDGLGAGPRYVPTGRRCRGVVTLGGEGATVPSGAEVVTEVVVPVHPGPDVRVWAAIGPDGGEPSC